MEMKRVLRRSDSTHGLMEEASRSDFALLQQILNEFQKEEGLKEKGKALLGNVVTLGTDTFLRKITMISLEEAKKRA